ncbi:type VI secretion system lipoprotein TssJ [bacterium]|nr:type VI secretion system lipoprotein TssJ [bacterium]
MRQSAKAVALICFLLLCSSCGMMPWSKPKPSYDGKTAYEPRYEKNALTVNIRSDPRLNLYQERPHSLVLCMYELKEPNMFNQLSDERGGIYKLMECGRFDGSVAYARRQIVQPGEDVTDVRDRAEGAKYLGIAAGYYDLKKSSSLRLLPIDRIGPGAIVIDLILGPREIQDIRVRQ